jgi:hypothetical protein
MNPLRIEEIISVANIFEGRSGGMPDGDSYSMSKISAPAAGKPGGSAELRRAGR